MDIRLRTTFTTHVKTAKLKKRTGADGVLALLTLWTYAAEHKPSGDLSGMSFEDVELAAGWTGEAGAFVQHAVAVGYIDHTEGRLTLHDWETHQPWAAHAEERSERARSAVTKRWNMQRVREQNSTVKPDASGADTQRIGDECAPSAECNTPSPSPSPSPTSKTKESTPDGVQASIPNACSGLVDDSQHTPSTNPASKAKRTREPQAKPNGGVVWGSWVDANREAGRANPVPTGKDTRAARELAKLLPQGRIGKVLSAFLNDHDDWLVKQGHPLRLLPGRVNAYLNGDGQEFSEAEAYRDAELRICAEARAKTASAGG